MAWRRCKQRDAGAEGACKDHTTLCIDLIDGASQRAIPGDLTFDSSFTSAKGLHHIQRKPRAYGGARPLHRQGVGIGREQKLQAVARDTVGGEKAGAEGEHTVGVLQ